MLHTLWWDKKWVLAWLSLSECTARVKLELTDFKWEDGKPVDKTDGKTVDKIIRRDGSPVYIAGANFLKGLSLSETVAYWKNQAKNQAKDMPPW